MKTPICPRCFSEYVRFSKKSYQYDCEDCGHVWQNEKLFVPLRIFLSYGHDANEDLVLQIKNDLEQRGHNVWVDKRKIKSGEDWRRAITDGILKSNRVLSFLSRHSTRNPGVCLDEIGIAIGVKGGNIQTILIESENEVKPPPSISYVQWLDMHDWKEIKAKGGVKWKEWYQAKLLEIISVVESDESRRFAGEIEDLSRYLKPISSDSRIGALLQKKFFGRTDLIAAIEHWRCAEHRSKRLFWIKGDPGVGKSAFAAYMTHFGRDKVIAAQFCEWDKPHHCNATRIIRSLAFQVATRLPDYRKILLTLPEIRDLDKKNPSELFDYLLTNPLNTAISGGRERYLFVIDALDEAEDSGHNSLADILARHIRRLPDWIGVVVTSRPENRVTKPFSGITPEILDSHSRENKDDIKTYLQYRLARQLNKQYDALLLINQIIDRSEGVFLYIERFCEEVIQKNLSLDHPEHFPQGLNGIFYEYFSRQFPEEEKFESNIEPILGAIVAAQEPLQVALLQKIFNMRETAFRKHLQKLGALFPVKIENGVESIKPYHKSLSEWLTDDTKSGPYYVSETEGQKLLADFGWMEYESLGEKMNSYFLSFLPVHLSGTEQWERLEMFLSDQKIIRAQCDSGRAYDIVRNLHILNRLGRPMERAVQSLIEVFKDNMGEQLRQQFRSALIQFFGSYCKWPRVLRKKLEKSNDLKLVLFLGDTHDMEENFIRSEAVFRRFFNSTSPSDPVSYATACARLAYVLEHQERYQEALEITETFSKSPDIKKKCEPRHYWWVQYQRAINLRCLYRYDEAIELLKSIHGSKKPKDKDASALHQIGVADLELGRLENAEKIFKRCIKIRGEKKWDHRRAFEHRRLGEDYAFMGKKEDSEDAFNMARDISIFCGNQRYINVINNSRTQHLVIPEYIEKTKPKTIVLDSLAKRFKLKIFSLAPAFRVLWKRKIGFLPEISSKTGKPTGRAIRWDIAHSEKKYWHATVMVLIIDKEGRLALQKRSEKDSMGKLDVSVSGHMEVGETDEQCAIRETAEEAGVVTSPLKLTRLFKPFQLVKEGAPGIKEDRHMTRFKFKYKTNKINQERTSVFILRIDHMPEPKFGAMSMRWIPFADAIREAEKHPERFASGFRQLLHPQIIMEIRKGIDS